MMNSTINARRSIERDCANIERLTKEEKARRDAKEKLRVYRPRGVPRPRLKIDFRKVDPVIQRAGRKVRSVLIASLARLRYRNTLCR